jgi:hypothetical protein
MLTYDIPINHIHNLGILSIYYNNMTPLIMEYTSMEMVYVNMDSGIYHNAEWHMPKCIVAYTTMQSGISQNG